MGSKITVNKYFLPEMICIEYLLILGLLSGYLEFSLVWKIVLFVLLLYLLMIKRRYRNELLRFSAKNIFFWSVVFLGLASILLGRSNEYLLYNAKRWIMVVIMLCVVDLLISNEKLSIRSVLVSHFYFLNFFWIVNLIVLAIQCTGNGFMIKAEWLAVNGFYPDQCSGLFGNSGTHKLSLFTIFMMVYNLHIAEEIHEKTKRRIFYAYILITQSWMVYLSTINDNKTLFVLIPFFFFLFYAFRRMEESKRLEDVMIRMARYARVIIPACIGIVLLLTWFPSVSEFVEERVIQAAIKLASQGSVGSRGSIERLTIAMDALKGGQGFLFGDGLGTSSVSEWISGSYRGYRHFGMSSMGNFITLGGVWFYLCFSLFYVRVLVLCLNYKKNRGMCWLFSLGAIMGLTIYTVLFENMTSTLWVCLIFIMCGRDGAKETVETKKEKEAFEKEILCVLR